MKFLVNNSDSPIIHQSISSRLDTIYCSNKTNMTLNEASTK